MAAIRRAAHRQLAILAVAAEASIASGFECIRPRDGGLLDPLGEHFLFAPIKLHKISQRGRGNGLLLAARRDCIF